MKILNKVGIDRVLHFAFGGWIACLAPSWWLALLIAFAIGLFKECFDKIIVKSKFDVLDWLATFLGGCVTAIYLIIF